MNIDDRIYRTCTYLAGDWTNDQDAIKQIQKWNEGDKWSLHFNDVHKLTQSSDASNNCSIKESLRKRLMISKKFVLVVGDKTNELKSGACHLCPYCERRYEGINLKYSCKHNLPIDNRSFVEYECEMAKLDYDNDKMEIIVLYNSDKVDKSKCPEILRNIGIHIPMKHRILYFPSEITWDYNNVKDAID